MKDIVGYEGLYSVTSCGKVWSYKAKKFLKAREDKYGYLRVDLHKNGKLKTRFVHQLVAEAYIPNPDGLPQVSHQDECKTHNWVGNLAWSNALDNNRMPLHCQRISDSKCKSILCVETNTIFYSIDAAAGNFGISACSIGNCLNGRQKTAGGYHWSEVIV